jgi:hypothetical protein
MEATERAVLGTAYVQRNGWTADLAAPTPETPAEL